MQRTLESSYDAFEHVMRGIDICIHYISGGTFDVPCCLCCLGIDRLVERSKAKVKECDVKGRNGERDASRWAFVLSLDGFRIVARSVPLAEGRQFASPSGRRRKTAAKDDAITFSFGECSNRALSVDGRTLTLETKGSRNLLRKIDSLMRKRVASVRDYWSTQGSSRR